jgi:hypothetical protein
MLIEQGIGLENVQKYSILRKNKEDIVKETKNVLIFTIFKKRI